MKAVRLHGPRDIRVEDIEEPGAPGAGEVLIAVRCVGVCGSDVHYYRDGKIGTQVVKKPIILGHEASGVVEETGPGVCGLKPGDHVALEPAVSCGKCECCLEGNPNLCPSVRFFGTPPVDGIYCQRVRHPAGCVFRMPHTMSFEEGAMLEPFGIGLHAARLGRIHSGDDVAVLGCGPIGLVSIMAARLAGASRVFASDLLPERLEHAKRLGAHAVFQAEKDDVVKAILEGTAGRGVDVVLEAAGTLATVEESMRISRHGGTAVLIGIPPEDRYEFSASFARHRGLTIKLCRRMKHTYPRAISLTSNGKVDPGSLVTHRFPLEKVEDSLKLVDAYADGVVKAVIEIPEDRG